MSHTILVFVNVSRQDAFVYLNQADDNSLFVAKLAAGQSTRQVANAGEIWNVTAGDAYPIKVGEKNRVYLIGTSGVYEVDAPRALPSEGGAASGDFDFPVGGQGSWP